jgi:hypothetical protein
MSFAINSQYEIPFLAGYSKDGKTIYIDRRLPRTIKIGDKEVDIYKYLAVHERVEKTLIDKHAHKYEYAHQLATAAEKKAVTDDGVDWEKYQSFMLRMSKQFEDFNGQLPIDLDITPEIDRGDYSLVDKIKELQQNVAKDDSSTHLEILKQKYSAPKEPSLQEKIKQVKNRYSQKTVKEPSLQEKIKQIKEKHTATQPKARSFDEEIAHIKEKYKDKVQKSNYGPKGAGLYNPVDSIKRKSNRTGEVREDVGQNKAVHQYTSATMGTAAQQASTEAKKYKKLNEKQPVKTYTEEEKAALQAKYEQTQKSVAVAMGLQPSSEQWLAKAAAQLGLPTDPKVAQELEKLAQARWENSIADSFKVLHAPIESKQADQTTTRGRVDQNDESQLTEEEQRIRAIPVNPALFKD